MSRLQLSMFAHNAGSALHTHGPGRLISCIASDIGDTQIRARDLIFLTSLSVARQLTASNGGCGYLQRPTKVPGHELEDVSDFKSLTRWLLSSTCRYALTSPTTRIFDLVCAGDGDQMRNTGRAYVKDRLQSSSRMLCAQGVQADPA